MHSRLLHRHPVRQPRKREEDTTLESNDSLANLVERAKVESDDVATIVSVVYVTASKTFSGAVAGYSTVGLEATSSTKAAKATAIAEDDDTTTSAKTTVTSKSTATASAKPATSSSESSSASTKAGTKTTASSLSKTSSESTSSVTSATISSVSSSSVVTSSVVTSSSVDATSSSSVLSGTALAQATVSSSASASASTAPAASTGLSSGAKGGIAFAVILALGLFAGLALVFYRKKKNQRKSMEGAQRLIDAEKSSPPPPVINTPPPVARVRTESPAPRLSIRPTSRFSLGTDPEKAAEGIAAAGAGAGAKKSVWERPGATRWPTTSASKANKTDDPANPFGIHAETLKNSPPSAANPTPVPALRSTTSFELQGSPVEASAGPTAQPVSASASVSNASALSPSAQAVSPSGQISPSIEITSPTKAEFGTAAAVPMIAAAVAPATSSPSAAAENVHRVQLEFKPSMDDELELRPGQLVRLLHEYDDGWALCMTMDRSKQGVAPRSCVSKHPLKQRPAGPPSSRPMSPMRGPPPQAQGARKVSGIPRPHGSMVPAPLSPSMNGRMSPSPKMIPAGLGRQRTASSGVGAPVQPRSMSPGPMPSKPMADTRQRSASVGTANAGKPTSPGKPSPLSAGSTATVPARKPVPGQAI